MKRAFLLLLPLLAACAPGIPTPELETVRRNVAIEVVKAKPVSIEVKLPVLLKAREEIELRAGAAGPIQDLPFEDGAVVPASAIPACVWTEADEYVALHPGVEPASDAVLLRNLAHLEPLKAFARIDDREARINFRDAQSQYDAATRALSRVLNYKESTEAAVDNARTACVAARAHCDRLMNMIEDACVTCPVTGVLKMRHRRAGEYVNVGELLGVVSVLDPLVAEIHVPEAHRASLKPGAEIEITIPSVTDAMDEPVKVKAIVRLVDAVAHAMTHSFRVEADIANSDLKLPAGVFGTTKVRIYENEKAITVPLSALKLKGEAVSLFVVLEDNTVREITNVRLGHMSSEWAEVLGQSLEAGQKLVVAGAQMLGDKDPVIIREDPTRPAAVDNPS